MMKLGAERDVCVLPVYAVSEDTGTTILDLAATMGVDYLILGASQRTRHGRTSSGKRGDQRRAAIFRSRSGWSSLDKRGSFKL